MKANFKKVSTLTLFLEEWPMQLVYRFPCNAGLPLDFWWPTKELPPYTVPNRPNTKRCFEDLKKKHKLSHKIVI
jgi:hypothetical protein